MALSRTSRTSPKALTRQPKPLAPKSPANVQNKPKSPAKPVTSEVKANSTAKATVVTRPAAASPSTGRQARNSFPQAPDISGGRILFGAGLSAPTKPPVKPAVARLELQEDSETEDDDEETVIQRAELTCYDKARRTWQT